MVIQFEEVTHVFWHGGKFSTVLIVPDQEPRIVTADKPVMIGLAIEHDSCYQRILSIIDEDDRLFLSIHIEQLW